MFVGNNDAETVVKHALIPPIKARYIRLLPTAWNNHISTRMELYGCFGKVPCRMWMEKVSIFDEIGEDLIKIQ